MIGGGIEVASQLYKKGEVNNWNAVGGATVQGMVTGGVAGLTGGASLLVTASASAGANAVGGAVNNIVQGKAITTGSVVKDFAVGAIAGVGGKLLDKGVNAIKLSSLNKEVLNAASNMQASGKFPATVVGAMSKGTKAIEVSGNIPSAIAPNLKSASSQVGGVGIRNAGNVVGCCSEFRAANQLMLNNPKLLPSDIKFTPAIRPRNMEVIPPCTNCKAIFNL